MKKASLRKVLVILVVAILTLLIFSMQGYAATKMMDEAIVSTYNSLGTEAGIYQTAINCYMDTNRILDNEIANTRTYYGEGETLKVRFSFSREVASGSNLRLGLKFGDGTERVATNPVINGSYVIFSYNIQNTDYFGGLTLTFIEGTVTDTFGNTISLGIQGSENTWTNTIIAKGQWADATTSNRQIIFPRNEINGNNFENKLQGGAYILEDSGRIRKMIESDVFILNTTDGSYTVGNSNNIEITYATTGNTNAVVNVKPKDNSSILLIDRVCDIAGNINGVCNGLNEVYVMPNDGNFVDGKYYYKEGKTVKFLSVGGAPVTEFTIGDASRTATVEKKLLSSGKDNNNVYICTYTIQNGDNGNISYGNGNYIADTTAPVINFGGISLQSGMAYYSSTDGAQNSTDGTFLKVQDNKMSGTIWLRKESNVSFSYSVSDNIGMNPMTTTEAKTELISEEGLYNPSKDISDYAGNIAQFLLTNYITILCDETGPNINITPSNISQRADAVDFTITSSDPNIRNATQYNGSGVQIGNDYKVVNVSNVMVSNGTIIGSSVSENNLNIRVMPNGDGYVSVYVPAGVTTDNLGNSNQASDIAKVYVDRTAPIINDVTGIPTDWVKEATLSVIATDEGVGGIQYSFNGEEYSTNNTYQVTANGNVRIKVKDALGNESEEKIVSITKINIVPAIVFDTTEKSCISKVETINGINYVIVPINTTANDLLKYITSSYNVTIKMSDSGKEVVGDSKLATNEMIVVDSINEQHRIVVKGDVTGNGKIGLSDLTKLNQFRLNKIALDKAEFLAGDVTGDGKISLGDITKLNQYRLNKIKEL